MSVSAGFLFFSGGSALNSVCRSLRRLTDNVAHVLPVSDNGGSSSEILRTLEGPAIGDIRSRLIRLADESNDEARQVKTLLSHRLTTKSVVEAKREYLDIVDGSHGLWDGIRDEYADVIRGFLVHFNTEVLRRAADFDFRGGSVGNFFFTGARMFFNSLEAAIFCFSRVAQISPHTHVIPVIHSNHSANIAAELENGQVIVGQHDISHPDPPNADKRLRQVDKDCVVPLEAPIRRIYYVNRERQEVEPDVNARVIDFIAKQNVVVYSMGSLYTSIIPCLVLKGVGPALAARKCPKVLLLNGTLDRETEGMTAIAFARAVARACAQSSGQSTPKPGLTDYVTHLFYPLGTTIPLDEPALRDAGVRVIGVAHAMSARGAVIFDEEALINELERLVLSEHAA